MAGHRNSSRGRSLNRSGVELDSSHRRSRTGEMLIALREVARATKRRIDASDNISSS